MMTFLRAQLAICNQKRAERIARQARFDAALAFNRLHTFSWSKRGGEWMCPSCNQIHKMTSTNVFSGRQFSACCEFPEGHRLHKHHATGL